MSGVSWGFYRLVHQKCSTLHPIPTYHSAAAQEGVRFSSGRHTVQHEQGGLERMGGWVEGNSVLAVLDFLLHYDHFECNGGGKSIYQVRHCSKHTNETMKTHNEQCKTQDN